MSLKGDETKARLLDAARDLAEAGGYFHTGLNHIIAESGAPRGSVYFHFPGGKDQIVSEAVTRSAEEIARLIATVPAITAARLVTTLIDMLADRLEDSGWRNGCPVATIALDVASLNDAIQEVCSAAYASWERALRDRLLGYGCGNASEAATTVLALIEGALLLARTHRSREPLTRAKHAVERLL
jgi:AcrR family transcriptional regulator